MKKLIGHIGVDSGQVLICDPCYIDSEWVNEDFEDIRRYEVIEDEMIIQYPRDFKNYEEMITRYDKTMNQMIEQGLVRQLPNKPVSSFSYNGCCNQTLGEKGFGTLNFKMGHEGAGVVSSTAFGDGTYPVYAEVGADGTIKSLTIDFMDDEEGDDSEERRDFGNDDEE